MCLLRLAQLAGVVAFLLLSSPATAFAITQSYEGKTIVRIAFQPAQQPLDERDLAGKTALLKAGEPVSAAAVKSTIEKLYASGRYEDIAVDAQDSGSGVVLTFLTRARQFVRNVVVENVPEPPNQGQLVTSTKLQLGTAFTRPQLRQSEEQVLDALRSDGLYKATLTSQVTPADHEQVDITMSVDPGGRARFSTPVIKGDPQRPADQIASAARWKRFFGLGGWSQVTQQRLSRGLDRIRSSYQKKDYLRAKISLEQMEFHPETNSVTPVISIDPGPRVVMKAEGAKVSKGKLRQLVPVYEEGAVDKDLLVEGQRNLTEYFQSKGYFEAQVDFETEATSKDLQTIDYAIAPGDRHKFVYLEITGNRYFDVATLRERMYMQPATFLRFRNGRYSEYYLRRDINSIKGLYQANGFRDVDVQSRVEDDYQGKNNEVAVFMKVSEGPQWLVNTISFEGLTEEQKQALTNLVRTTPGQPYSDFNVASDQDAVLNYFFNSGYPNATFEARVHEATEPNRMDVTYLVTPGLQQFVRDVLISGLNATDDSMVRNRIRDLDPGSPVSQSAINESQRRLYDLGVFARVDTAVQNQDGDTQYKYILYRFEEAHKYYLNLGFGAQIARIGRGDVNSLESPGGSAGFSPRVTASITRSNLWGIGHTAVLSARYSNIDKRAAFNYLAPQFKGNDNLSLSFTALYEQSFDVNTFNSKRQEGAIQLSQRLSKANSLQYRLTYRRVNVTDLVITPALIPLYSQPVQLGIFSTTFIQDRRDDPTDPRRGIYNTLDTGIASSLFGSKTSFSRVLARDSTYHPVGRNMVLARSTSFGVISKFSGPDVPLPERFFAGGASSHRGFAENQAGPRDTGSGIIINGQEFTGTGFPVGGRALLLNTVELRFPLIGDNIGGVVFHDAGNVYSTLGKMSFRFNQQDLQDFDYMVHALGFGIRYRTPIGPVRVDLAYALNPPRFSGIRGTRDQLLDPNLAGVEFVRQRLSHFQFHFSLGQAF